MLFELNLYRKYILLYVIYIMLSRSILMSNQLVQEISEQKAFTLNF